MTGVQPSCPVALGSLPDSAHRSTIRAHVETGGLRQRIVSQNAGLCELDNDWWLYTPVNTL